MANQSIEQLVELVAPTASDEFVVKDDAIARVKRMSLATLRANLLDSPVAGSVLFVGAGGVLAQDNSGLFWDDANNRLGVGTTTPSAKIQVGTINGAGGGDIYSFNLNGNPRVLLGDQGLANAFGGFRWDSALDAIQIFTAAAGNNQIVLRGTGLVGINETAPDAMLEVVSNSATEECLHLKAAASQTADILRVTDSADANLVVVDEIGRVGIGETSPITSLEISRDVTASNLTNGDVHASFSGITDNTKSTLIGFETNSNFGFIQTVDRGVSFSAYSLVLQPKGGNVGINDSVPDYKLDVNGTFGFTPGTSVTPVDNGDVVIEATNNTTLTFKLKGTDGVVRSGTLTLA